MKIIRVIVTVTMLLLAGIADANNASFVVTNVRVFDGEVMLPSPTNVVVKQGRIVAIGEHFTGERLPQVDGTGKTLLPGLIDAHAHTDQVEQLAQAVRFGVTTVLDMGTFPIHEPRLREAVKTNPALADFRSAGIWATAPGGHGTEYGIQIPTLTKAAQAEKFVQQRVAKGSDFLKIVINGVRHAQQGTPTLDSATVHALIRAAHGYGLLTVAHVESDADVRLAIAAKVDGLVHHWRDGGARPELAELIAAHKIFVMPTLTAPDGFLGTGPQALLADPLIAPYLSQEAHRELTKAVHIPPGMSMAEPNAGMASLIAAGVVLLAGSDAFNGNPRIVHGASLHRLLELFVAAGLTPHAALRSATANVADAFGLADRGRIKPGLKADLILVRGDPSTDIKATRDISKIWRGGLEIVRQPQNQQAAR